MVGRIEFLRRFPLDTVPKSRVPAMLTLTTSLLTRGLLLSLGVGPTLTSSHEIADAARLTTWADTDPVDVALLDVVYGNDICAETSVFLEYLPAGVDEVLHRAFLITGQRVRSDGRMPVLMILCLSASEY